MPSVLKMEGFSFYFYSHETTEPPNIHIDKENNSAKYWIDEVALAKNIG